MTFSFLFFFLFFGTQVIENVPEMGGKCQRMVQFRMECRFQIQMRFFLFFVFPSLGLFV